jgi:hypothetical protein
LFFLPLKFGKHKAVAGVPSMRHDEAVWERIARAQNGHVREYVFDKKQVDGFQYLMVARAPAVTLLAFAVPANVC